jgi:3-methylcrotonyl-CoA carboxylase alpha subunit
VLCDNHGNALHLHTRDCSVQRRHQKLIEEAPAPGIAAEVRERLHAAGLAVARAVGYRNAGTVEFLYSDGEFWFMEMNTRLQVEHCITEEILGLDLVEWQLRIAEGEALPFAQADLVARGHAVEVRVCAEDPALGFVPSAGRLLHARWPEGLAGVRVDAGFDEGDEVPSHYDSLLGKIIGRGDDRAAAIGALARGLAALRIVGVATNAAWLAGALAEADFRAARLSTRFVADHGERLALAPAPTADELAAAALVAAGAAEAAVAGASPWQTRDAFRLNLPAAQTWLLQLAGTDYPVTLQRSRNEWQVAALGQSAGYALERAGSALELSTGSGRWPVSLWRDGDRIWLWRGATRLDFRVVDPRHVDIEASHHEGELVARLPGTVVAVPVAVGDSVAAGATLMVLEAMKMEHAVLAPRAGIVARLNFARGDRVTEGAVLVELSEPASAAAG